MEPIAVNHITVDRALFAEAHAAVFSRKRRKMLLCGGGVFCAFGLILLAVQVRLPVASGLSFPTLLTGILVLIWALGLQKSELRRKFRAFRRINGDASERTVSCYRSYLTVGTGASDPIRIDYPDIREHRVTDHLCLLICNDHAGVMLARDGFTVGSWQTLLDAIEQARIEAIEAAKLLEMT